MSAAMQELIETFDFKPTVVEASAAGAPGYMLMRGIVQLADVENKNKRVYPRTVWERVLNQGSDFMTRLASNQVVGCLGHPESGKTAAREISHVMTKVWMEEKFLPECVICAANGPAHSHVMGEEKILNTPDGLVLQELSRAGIPIGISSRGRGSVRGGSGQQIVEQDFVLDTFDFVLDPSTPGAWGRVVTEGVMKACADQICCTSSEAELAAYRRIVNEAIERGDSTIAKQVGSQLVEAIEYRLSGATSAALEAAQAATARLLEATKTGRPIGVGAVGSKDDDNAPGAAHADARGMEEMGMITIDNPEVKKIVEQALTEQRQRTATALSEADTLRAENTSLKADLTAAKAGLSEATQQLRIAKFQVTALREGQVERESFSPSGPEMYDDTFTVSEALDAARCVIDELAEENDGLREENITLGDRVVAAEHFVEEVRVREARKAVVEHTKRVLAASSMSEEAKRAASSMLIESKSIGEVNRKFALLEQARSGAAPAASRAGGAADRAARAGSLPGAASNVTESHQQLLSEGQAAAQAREASRRNEETASLTEAERTDLVHNDLLMSRLLTGKMQPLAS